MIWLLKLGITMLTHSTDDIEFVTELPCFMGHPLSYFYDNIVSKLHFLLLLQEDVTVKTSGYGK